LSEEYRKYFPTTENIPIIRDLEKNRYWVNENLLVVQIEGKRVKRMTSPSERRFR
jgi:hypothetical protein